MNFLKYAKYLVYVAFVGQLIDFIKLAEAIFSGPGRGEEKLTHVVSEFVPVVQQAQQAGLINDKLAQALIEGAPQIVSLIVQLMNAVHGSVLTCMLVHR